MKKLIYVLILLMLTSCGSKSKEGGISSIPNTKKEEFADKNYPSKEKVKPKSPILKHVNFKPKKLNYEIIKPDFLLKDRFADLKTQDKYGTRMMEYYDDENNIFYVSRLLTEALQDPKVKLEDDFDDKMYFIRDLFLISPYYSQGKMEAYIYANYWFDEDTFKIVPRYQIEENTKTYMTEEETEQVERQLQVLVDYANENYDNNYDKAYYFAQWLAENNEYQFDASPDNIIENNMYGALVKGLSQCSGFAQSFAILCQRVGIPTYSVTGNTKQKKRPDGYSGEHQWNVIKLNDNWSYVDVTGMVANGSPYYFYYFDRSKKEFTDYYVSDFFNDIEQYIR